MNTRKNILNSAPLSLLQELEALADARPSLRPCLDFSEPGDELAAVDTTLRNQARALHKLLGASRAAADQKLPVGRPSLGTVRQLIEHNSQLEMQAAERFPPQF